MEAKQSTPSVIARLMGLDELTPQEPVQKPQRVLSENYLRRVASIGVGKKRTFYERHSPRTNLEEKKESKDVCQVSKILKGDKHLEQLPAAKGKANLGLSVQKCITPKEVQDSSEFVDSKNDYFQKGIPKRSSFLSNCLHDPQGSLVLSLSKSSCNSARRNVDMCRKSRSKSELGYLRSLQKLENGSVTGSHGEELSLNFHDFARSQLVTQNEACSPHTRIVVLKPICGKAEGSERYFSSPSSNEGSHLGDSKCAEFCNPEIGRIQVRVKDLECDVESSRQRSTASRKILEELSRRTRWRKAGFSTKVASLGLRGSDTSAIKPELLSPPSSCSSDWGKRYQSFSSSNKSYVSRKTKKQLFERPLVTEKFKVEPSSRISTLDELLAMQYRNSRSRNHKAGSGRHGLRCLDLSKFATQRSKCEAVSSKCYVGLEKSLNQASCKLRKHGSFQKEDSESNGLKSNSGKSKFLHCLSSEAFLSAEEDFVEDINTSEQSWVRRDEMKNNLEGGNLFKQNVMLPKPSMSTVGFESDMVVDAETDIGETPSGESENEKLEPTMCVLLEEDDDSSSRATDTSVQQVCFFFYYLRTFEALLKWTFCWLI